MIKNKKLTIPLNEIVLTLYVIGYLIISILPMVKYSVPYIVSGLYCLLFVAFYFFKAENKRQYLFFILILGVLGVAQGLIAFLNENAEITELVNEPIRLLRIFAPCIILSAILKSPKSVRVIIWLLITALFIYISIVTIDKLSSDNMIARKLASGEQDETLTEYRMQNVGGFEFSYAFGLMLPLFFSVIFNSKKFFYKMFFIVFIAYVFYYIIETQYMILFILAMISLFLLIIFGSFKPQVKIFGLLFVILFLLFGSAIFRRVADLEIGELLRKRLLDIADVLDGNITIDATSSRIAKYKDALSALLNNPFGQYHSEAAFRSHSLILSSLSSVGVIGIVFLAIEFNIYYKTTKSIMHKNNLVLTPFIMSFICYIILAFINPIGYSYEIAIIVFLYVPLSASLFIKKNGKYELTNKKNYSGEFNG